MKLKNSYSVLLLSIIIFLCGIQTSAGAEIPEKPSNYVVDLAGMIQPDVEAALNSQLAELERKTTAQMFILTINSLEGESLEDLSLRVAHDKWKIGQKGIDNGVLLLVSLQDRKARFEIGYGLEGILTDAYSKRIINEALIPQFKLEKYSEGITAATGLVMSRIAADTSDTGVGISENFPTIRAEDYPRSESPPKESTLSQKVIKLILLLVGIILFIKYPRFFILLLLMSGRGGGGRGGGGGFSGGGGSFGGGGGGGFGGGGASGSW